MLTFPVGSEDRITMHFDMLDEMIVALGTPAYGVACLRVIGQALDAEHWTLFRYRVHGSINCLADGSRARAEIARENIARFVEGLHHVDPVMVALKKRRSNTAVLTNLRIEDIRDGRYRECFELAHARERVSYILRNGGETYFVNVYRGARRCSYSPSEMKRFASLARFIVSTASKHEALLSAASPIKRALDLDGIEQGLMILSDKLSKREREVCLRAAAGKTIERTALDLEIGATSVITYRQRAYKKLGINRQSELMAMVANLHSSFLQRKENKSS